MFRKIAIKCYTNAIQCYNVCGRPNRRRRASRGPAQGHARAGPSRKSTYGRLGCPHTVDSISLNSVTKRPCMNRPYLDHRVEPTYGHAFDAKHNLSKCRQYLQTTSWYCFFEYASKCISAFPMAWIVLIFINHFPITEWSVTALRRSKPVDGLRFGVEAVVYHMCKNNMQVKDVYVGNKKYTSICIYIYIYRYDVTRGLNRTKRFAVRVRTARSIEAANTL